MEKQRGIVDALKLGSRFCHDKNVFFRHSLKYIDLHNRFFPDYETHELLYLGIFHHLILIPDFNSSWWANFFGFPCYRTTGESLVLLRENDYDIYNHLSVKKILSRKSISYYLYPFIFTDILVHTLYDKSHNTALFAANTGFECRKFFRKRWVPDKSSLNEERIGFFDNAVEDRIGTGSLFN